MDTASTATSAASGWLFPMAAGAMSVGGSIAQNWMNRREGRDNRKFQERMSNTAYQRAAKDMEAAGLNKYAMYGGSHPASSPGGAQAHMENPMQGGISSALAAKEAKARVDLLEAQADTAWVQNADARIDLSLKESSGPGEIPYRVYRMMQRAHELNMQPHQLRGVELENMARALGIPVSRLKADLSTWASSAVGAARRGYGAAGEAASTLGAWKQAIGSILRANAKQVSSKNELARRRSRPRSSRDAIPVPSSPRANP